jgi:archaemetzincin
MASLRLLPIVPAELSAIERLAVPLQSILNLRVEIDRSFRMHPAFAYDQFRNQYNSSSLIAALLDHYPAPGGKILGITNVDLFVPVLTFVFGEAQLDGPMSVVSTFRLDEVQYGLPSNPSILDERLLKEAVHELGHTFGLFHCREFDCVMHSSTGVEEIDIKNHQFCINCRVLIDRAIEKLED